MTRVAEDRGRGPSLAAGDQVPCSVVDRKVLRSRSAPKGAEGSRPVNCQVLAASCLPDRVKMWEPEDLRRGPASAGAARKGLRWMKVDGLDQVQVPGAVVASNQALAFRASSRDDRAPVVRVIRWLHCEAAACQLRAAEDDC